MHFALIPPVRSDVTADPAWMTGFARHAEALGFESIVVVEHAVIASQRADGYPYAASGAFPLPDRCVVPDPLDLLAYLAAVTTTLTLATGVLILPLHHPVLLAKRLATIDQLSGGRLRLCVGVGWMREELAACGVDFGTRGRRTDESIEVLRTLWGAEDDGGVSFHGDVVHFDGVHSNPKPVRSTGVPIHIGGHSDAAARRAGRAGDGFQPLGLRGEELAAKVALMGEAAVAAGRDPSRLELSLGASLAATTPETVEEAAAAGADRLVLSPSAGTDLAAVCDEMSAFAERVGLR
jgi:probable F420-dependent oxidoreductase